MKAHRSYALTCLTHSHAAHSNARRHGYMPLHMNLVANLHNENVPGAQCDYKEGTGPRITKPGHFALYLWAQFLR